MIDEAKTQLGVLPLKDALTLAMNRGLDLVEIAPNATPPVCRIVDYGKFLYEEAKAASHSKQTGGRMKEIQLSPVISSHDLATKRDHAISFLCDDMKVRVKLRFRGRQRAHKDIGFQVVNQFVKEIASYGSADAPPKMLGDRDLNVVLSPLPRNKRATNPKAAAIEAPPAKQPSTPALAPKEEASPPEPEA